MLRQNETINRGKLFLTTSNSTAPKDRALPLKTIFRCPGIDALRGIAAFLVLVFHSREELWIGISELWRTNQWSGGPGVWLGYMSIPFSYGDVAVTLFFVLSGFCIHLPGAVALADRGMHAPFRLGDYAWRRFWRIYPTYAAALAFTGAANSFAVRHLPQPTRLDLSWITFLGSLGSLQNTVTGQFGNADIFWSLAVEIHLYLVYPLLFAGSRHLGPVRVVLGAFAASVLVALADWYCQVQGIVFLSGKFFFFRFLFIWLLGFWAAEIHAGRVTLVRVPAWGWWTIACAGMVARISHKSHFSASFIFADLLLGIAFFRLVLHSTTWSLDSSFGKPIKVAASVGTFSFSLYAIHRAVLLAFRAMFDPTGSHRGSLLFLIAGIAVSVLCGIAFYVVVERPALKVCRYLPSKGFTKRAEAVEEPTGLAKPPC